jgi:DNA-binding transcriptional LysR family regulator
MTTTQLVQLHLGDWIGINIAPETVPGLRARLGVFAAGIGNAILPRSVSFIAGPDVTLYPLSGPSSEWKVSMVWNPDFADPIRDHFVRQVIASYPLPVSATPER